MKLKMAQWGACRAAGGCPKELAASAAMPCVGGMAGEYPCDNVDLMAFVPLATLGAPTSDGNDIWGYTDPVSNREYAIAGTESGTSFVDVTDPTKPCVLGFLRTKTRVSLWRDIKVFQGYAFIVSEALSHGMQIYDLKQLRGMACPSAGVPIFTETAHYNQFGSAHNLVINEDSGFAYAVGSTTCSGGLHVVDIRNPTKPLYAGCFSQDGYVHDAQCINYKGPDPNFVGKEVCFCYNEDALTIVDVSTKSAMKLISKMSYQGYQYTHQGWLLPNNKYLMLNDELDEMYNSNHHTRTMLWDVQDLPNPFLRNSFYSTETVIDHNLYTLNNRAYLANYCGGLRIYDTSNAASGGALSEIAYFDVAPQCSDTEFFGSWSSYPYFPSGTIVVMSIERGMFVLKFNDGSQ